MNPQPKLYHFIDIEGEKKLRHVNPFQAPSIYACRTDEEIENYNQFEQSAIANAKVLINPVPGKAEYSSDEIKEVWQVSNGNDWYKICNYQNWADSVTRQAFEYIGEKVEENEYLETDMKKASDSGEQAERSNQQKIIDGLSGVIESQKQTMEAMGKRLLMIEQVISGSSNPLTIRIGNILNPTAESAFNQPRFYTEADMLAMGEAVKDEILKSIDAEEVYTKPKSQNAIPVFLGCQIDPESIPNINVTQILKTINDGKQQ